MKQLARDFDSGGVQPSMFERIRRSVTILCGLYVLGSVPSLAAQTTGGSRTETADRLLRSAIPHFEHVTGTHLEKVPGIRQATVSDRNEARDPELAAQVRWQFPELSGNTLFQALEVARDLMWSASVVRFDANTNCFLLIANPVPQASAKDQTATERDSLLQLTMVHELARHHLTQRFNLAKRWAICRDAEEFEILHSVFEGEAIWITREVARRLDIESACSQLTDRFANVPDVAKDAHLRLVSQTVLQQRRKATMEGWSFVRYLHEKQAGDVERIIFENLPQQVQIARPEIYLNDEPRQRRDLAIALHNLDRAMPESEWDSMQQSWTPAMVRQVSTLVGLQDRAERAVRNWEEGRSIVWSMKKPSMRQVAVSAVRFENPTAARSYFEFALDLQRKRDEMQGPACNQIMRVVESRTNRAELKNADESIRGDKRLQFPASANTLAESKILSRRGNMVVEFVWYDTPADDAWADQVLGRIINEATVQNP